MSYRPNKLEEVWTMMVKEELLTVLWGILTVLLFTSDVNFLEILSWFTAAWTLICAFNIVRSAWPKNKETIQCFEEVVPLGQVNDFLRSKFMSDEFAKLPQKEKANVIMNAAVKIHKTMEYSFERGRKT